MRTSTIVIQISGSTRVLAWLCGGVVKGRVADGDETECILIRTLTDSGERSESGGTSVRRWSALLYMLKIDAMLVGKAYVKSTHYLCLFLNRGVIEIHFGLFSVQFPMKRLARCEFLRSSTSVCPLVCQLHFYFLYQGRPRRANRRVPTLVISNLQYFFANSDCF